MVMRPLCMWAVGASSPPLGSARSVGRDTATCGDARRQTKRADAMVRPSTTTYRLVRRLGFEVGSPGVNDHVQPGGAGGGFDVAEQAALGTFRRRQR